MDRPLDDGGRVARRGVVATLAALLFASSAHAGSQCPIWFSGFETLGPPGITKQTVSIVSLPSCAGASASTECWTAGGSPPGASKTIRLRYWLNGSALAAGTLVNPVQAMPMTFGTRYDFEISGLTGGAKYGYRIECKEGASAQNWSSRPSSTFQQLPSTATAFTFLVESDSHLVQYYKSGCAFAVAGWLQAPNTFNQMSTESATFAVDTGDTVMMNDGGSSDCPTPWGATGTQKFGASNGDANMAPRAKARYWIVSRTFHPILRKFGFVYALGNHDGEISFENNGGTVFYTGARAASITSRNLFFSNPADSFRYTPAAAECTGGACSTTGNYFTFCAGPTTTDARGGAVCTYAQFWVLDDFADTNNGGTAANVCFDGSRWCPESPDDWTLGAAQLAWWQNTVERSHAKFKFTFSHHLLGGVSGPATHFYARMGTLAVEGRTCSGGGEACATDFAHSGSLRSSAASSCVTSGETCLPGLSSNSTGTVDGIAGANIAQKNRAFAGQQKSLHRILENRVQSGGSNFWFWGHDHVAYYEQKRNYNGNGSGVWYFASSQSATGGAPSWMFPAAQGGTDQFQDLTDLDRDGISDTQSQDGASPALWYPTGTVDTDGQGTNRRGYYKVSVDPSTGVYVEFIQTRCDTDLVTCAGNWTSGQSFKQAAALATPIAVVSQTVLWYDDFENQTVSSVGCQDSFGGVGTPYGGTPTGGVNTTNADCNSTTVAMDGKENTRLGVAASQTRLWDGVYSTQTAPLYVDLLWSPQALSAAGTTIVLFNESGVQRGIARNIGTGKLSVRCHDGATENQTAAFAVAGTTYKVRIKLDPLHKLDGTTAGDSMTILADPMAGSFGAGQLASQTCETAQVYSPGVTGHGLAGNTTGPNDMDDVGICSGAPVVGRACKP